MIQPYFMHGIIRGNMTNLFYQQRPRKSGKRSLR